MSFETIKDIVDFNPSRPLSKGKEFPFIDMASLPVNGRDINEVSNKVFNGGGAKFKNGDTLFARITPCLENGKTAKVENLPVGCIAHGSTEFIVLSAKSKDDEDFVYYLARLPDFRSYAISRMEGTSGRQRVSWQALAEFNLRLPEKGKRKKIGKILKSLDDKIHLNNQINQTLESIAQTIFKSWFIDFDPVRAKIAAKQEGKDAELAAMCAISGKSEAEVEQMAKEDFAELQATATLFPDELVESELGEVPKGWEITNINAVTASIFSGGTPSTKEVTYWNGEIPWLSSGETRNKIIVSTEKSITETAVKKSSTKLAIFGDILIASAGQGHTRGQTSFNAIECYINQSIVALRANDKVSPYWLYYCLEPRYDEMRSVSDSHSSRGSLTTKLLASMPVILPTQKLVVSFDKVIKPMLAQQVKNAKEIKMLADTRDALLPKLISGDIEVSSSVSETEYEYSAE
ncbi:MULTISPECIES: restriction endonuclease subunit S [Acinetobacter]|nr:MULTISPECIES: restriction endonuclease subunit S [Acinetobacter]MCU4323778.1 restriction endonuclease subunit S [Acinetobacter schindleri]MCU4594583.1 restriction endonuclease subunit S [Acinetobacter radioresistens]MCU4605166.1 restriction endonuclease subunit S [Acinetobacter radioresistens]